MKRTPRCNYEKGFFHVMVQGINKKYIFEKNIEKEEYLSLLLQYKNNFKIMLLAYCIMDNHAHILIHTDEVYEMSNYMRVVNSKFARNYNRSFDRVGYVFRDRFNSQYINTEAYVLKCLRYIHMNPVKANMVKRPEEYKYSSYNNFLNKDGIVDQNVINKIFGNMSSYMEKFLNISSEEIEVMDIDREQENFMVVVKEYMLSNKTSLKMIKENKKILYDFCNYLVQEKHYKQVQVADLLNYDIKKIYYIIKKTKEAKISLSKKEKNIEN